MHAYVLGASTAEGIPQSAKWNALKFVTEHASIGPLVHRSISPPVNSLRDSMADASVCMAHRFQLLNQLFGAVSNILGCPPGLPPLIISGSCSTEVFDKMLACEIQTDIFSSNKG